MGTGRTDEFRKDAVRIALTSGLSRRQVADDLGVGLSTLNKWVNAHRDTDVVSSEDRELAVENERLRREIRILKAERDILKNGHGSWPFFSTSLHSPGKQSPGLFSFPAQTQRMRFSLRSRSFSRRSSASCAGTLASSETARTHLAPRRKPPLGPLRGNALPGNG